MKPLMYAMPYSQKLAEQLASLSGAELGKLEVRRFPDGDSYVRVDVVGTSVEDRDVVIVAPLDRPDDKILPIWFLADNLRDLGAGRIGLVCPYLPYMRQDRRFLNGEALTSNFFARMMSSHFDWMVTVDPHLHRHKSLDAIYTIPSEVVHAAPLIAAWIRTNVEKPIIIGPDEESEQWVASVASQAGAPHLVLKKTRTGDRAVKVEMPDLGEFSSQTPVVVDDIISTAHTMIETVKELKTRGTPPPYCVGVHGIFAGRAHMELKQAGAAVIATCNTVNHPTNQIDISSLLAPAIERLTAATAPAAAALRTGNRPDAAVAK
ncbi:MAG: ribose-phosphate pyrophosphokinase [Rhodospirillaceae bacterium]|nr:ribose-phosphate pyrophosphokinase [Rhodospirillaceae bacterium]